MKIYAILMPNGKLRHKIYLRLDHAKNGAHLRKGSVVVEYEAKETGVTFELGEKIPGTYYDYQWIINDENLDL